MPRDNAMLIYRLYLPLIGVAIVMSVVINLVLRQKRKVRVVLSIVIVLFVFFCLFQCVYQNILMSDNIAMWENIKARFPQSHIPDFNIGSVYLRQKKVNEAIFCFRESLQKEPTDPKVLYNLATALQLKGEVKESLMYYKRAHVLAPNDNNYFIGLGNAYYLDQQYVKALHFYNRYVESFPLAADIFNNIFYCYSALGNDRAALASISQAITIDEKRIFLISKAMCLFRLADYEQSLSVLNHVEDIYGTAVDVVFQRGVIAQQQKKYGQALSLYLDVLQEYSEHIGALNNSGVLLYQRGEYDKARERWAKVLSIEPKNRLAIENMKRLKKEKLEP